MAEADGIDTARDPDGAEIVLLARVWQDKISRDHPELRAHRDTLMATIAAPDHIEPDPLPGRRRFYRRTTSPSRWLMVVVSYEQQPARIITAMALRKDPRSWNR